MVRARRKRGTHPHLLAFAATAAGVAVGVIVAILLLWAGFWLFTL
jgi:hypothetical protein